MSTAKRSRRRQVEAGPNSPLPAAKRLKTATNSHVPAKSGLEFLVDEDARVGKKMNARLTNGVPASKATRVDESHAQVAPETVDDQITLLNGKAGAAASMSESEDDSEDSEDEEDARLGAAKPTVNDTVNGHVAGEDSVGNQEARLGAEDDRMEDVQEQQKQTGDDEPEEDAGEPSFGDMLQVRHPEPIDVHASLPDPTAEESAMVPTSGSRALTLPSGTSMYGWLTQALKTNDKDMLEKCFEVTDLQTIRSTIQRLQSQNAAILLQNLSERIHKRPGRTGNLMLWVQWALVAHGAYLATQPEVMGRLRSLAQVVRARASGLQPLLHLKGKLDLLSSQLELRHKMHLASRAAHAVDEDDEEAVLYVDGQDDDWSEAGDDVDTEDGTERKLLKPPSGKSNGATTLLDTDGEVSDDDDSGSDLPNGVAQEEDEDMGEDEEEGEEGIFDDEAEEASDDEEASSADEEQSAPESENDTDPSEDESELEIRPPPPKTLNRKR